MLTGEILDSATITFVDGNDVVQQTIELRKVNVTSLGMKSGGEPFFEEFELSYGEIRFSRPGSVPDPVGWNLVENRLLLP
jgi:hypothetical protein